MSVKTTGFQTVEVGMYIDKKKVVKIEHTDYGKFKSGVRPYLKLIMEDGSEIYNSTMLHGELKDGRR